VTVTVTVTVAVTVTVTVSIPVTVPVTNCWKKLMLKNVLFLHDKFVDACT
jgi:hypothetical protein